jgi:acyl CoA:acetate/3-ketoacid CoA transferase beta subunit
MQHCDKKTGEKKVLKKCTLPLTGIGVVHLIVSDLAVMEVTKEGLVLREHAPGITPAQVQEQTEAKLIIPKDVKPVSV